MIENIKQGMTAAQVFDILNRLIDEHNQMMSALGGTLVNGKFDYNRLINKPSINNVELRGNLTQADLDISIDTTVVRELDGIRRRVGETETKLREKVSFDDLATKLEVCAKKIDLPDVSGLATRQELNLGLDDKVGKSEYNSTVTRLNTAISTKADAGVVPTTVQWDNLLTLMESKVTQAGNSASSASSAASAAVQEAIRDLPNNTTVQRIVSKVNEVVKISNILSASECGSKPLERCLDPVQRLVINS